MADTKPSTHPGGAKPEFPCPDCGEMVREGLVRCWNCGGFLRPEMEEQFQKMQSKPTKVIYSPLPDDADASPDLDSLMRAPMKSSGSDGDDFQLATDIKHVAAPTITGADSKDSSPPSSDDTATAETETPSAEEAPPSTGAAGDALLELAAAEALEKAQKLGSRAVSIDGVKVIRDGFLIDTPKGCRIQVRDERTGEMRRLTFGASSRVRISMLDKLEAIAKAKKEAAERQAAGPKHLSAGKYQRWMSDARIHTINPAKLKLVANSLTKEFVPVELGFAEDEFLVVSLRVAKKGLFGGGKGSESADEAREALLQHLRAGKSLEGESVKVAGDVITHFSADQIAELRVVQPAATLSESLFAGIPVFGDGRIAVQLPVKEAGEQPKVLSFTLSEFREFVEIVRPLYLVPEFGRNLGIPLTDAYQEIECHFSNESFRALDNIAYYDADPSLETELCGYKCEACGIAVSETSRQKANLGGKGGKGIAKAKCPKCEKKMGHVPLYRLAVAESEAAEQSDDSTDAPAAVATDAPPPTGASAQPAAEGAEEAKATSEPLKSEEKPDSDESSKPADAAKE